MKKKWLKSTLALLLTGTMVLSMAPTVKAEETKAASGTTYYVDARNGNDEYSGTSEAKPFMSLNAVNELDLEPGDRVLLKAGSVFESQALKFDKEDSGTAEAPVIISTYGNVEKDGRPVINTNGEGRWEQNYGVKLDNQNHKWHGTVSSCILIQDTEYIEISGLEMTNQIGDGSQTVDARDGSTVVAYNNAYAMDRTGVAGVAQDNGTVDHIVLDDLYIHDIKGNVYNKHMCNGGIYFIVAKPEDESTTGIARYDDVEIRNCYLDTVNRWGIAVGFTYQHSQFNGSKISDEVASKYGSTNVVIENNYLNNVGGDAITTMYLDRSVVQYNVAENIAAQINTTDYSQQQPSLDTEGNYTSTLQNVGAHRVAAGIWPWKCKNAVFQFNECFSVLNASRGNGDGQPWDADWGDGTLYQYNYSHGNSASTIMFCGENSIDTTFRYNISVNEDMGPLDPAGNVGYAHVYNNTFIIKEGINSIWHTSHGNNGPVNCENNIFYFQGDTQTVSNWNINNNKTYDNNLYYNVSTYPADENAVKVSAGTEVFVDVTSAPSSPAADLAARFDENGNADLTTFGGLKLAENSPAINAGKVITDQNGYTESNTRDFFGNPLTVVPEIGAADCDVVGDLALRSNVYTVSGTSISDVPKKITVESFLNNLVLDPGVSVSVEHDGKELKATDIVKPGSSITLSYEGKKSVTYKTTASSAKELLASNYMVTDKNIYVPYTDSNPTIVREVKQNITVSDTAEISVVSGDKVLKNAENVAAGMIVRITAEDGSTNDYTIVQKNTYNWTLDYVNAQQGNVWFAQQKNGSGNWTNMTSYDSTYPNWVVNTWYGVGVDAKTHSAEITESTHGLISAPPNTNISTAMAFRAPKTGTVSFNVNADEPYLRQSDNTGGTVTLKLFVNDEELQSVTMSNSLVQAADWKAFDAIKVKAGDYIRVVASCTDNPSKPSLHVTPNITYIEETKAEKPFNDLTGTKYYYDPVLWATDLEVVNGYLDGTFRPEADCTRVQVVTFLWRAAGKPTPTITSCNFSDVDEDNMNEDFYDAILWAVENQITTGYLDGTFKPDQEVRRCEFATFQYRASGRPDVTNKEMPFADVTSVHAHHESAILWAVEEGITNGYNDGGFHPDQICSRGDVVAFLYRNR